MTNSLPTYPLHGAQFDNAYHRLGGEFYHEVLPTPVKAPRLIALNHTLALALNLDPAQLAAEQGVAILAGNALPQGANPLAQAYSGHQFGHFNPQLGDGRAILLGELLDNTGQHWDLQLKGPGRTAFSRSGDGRAAIGPVIREFILAEAMHKLGVKTTRALAAVTTGETVLRERALPGAVLTRVASSHIRVGTFEYFRARAKTAELEQLTQFAIQRHYPHATTAADLLRAVQSAQIQLVASWMSFGFIHGVMNTDNTAISGETIDYGPCAFMEAYDPATVFSSIDHQGRYAYNNQPNIALWNLTRLAECLLLLLPDSPASVKQVEQVLQGFSAQFNQVWLGRMANKLGMLELAERDIPLLQRFLQLLQDAQVDFTLGFRSLNKVFTENAPETFTALFKSHAQEAGQWQRDWRTLLEQSGLSPATISATLQRANPVYIPRNHIVEEVIQRAAMNDFAPLEQMMQVLATPFDEQPGAEALARPANASERVYQTFCGT